LKAESKYKASIKLSAIGDALGWITEFEKDANSIKRKYNIETVDNFLEWEKFVGGKFLGYKDKMLPGSYSDDTQLMLATARCINNDGSINNERFAKMELANWLLYSRGGGKTVKTAAEKIKRKSVKWHNNFFTYKNKDGLTDYRDSGANGAAMRILPITLANFSNFENTKEQIFSNSIITHGHPRAIIGALLYGYAIEKILYLNQDNFNPDNYIIEIGKELKSILELSFLAKAPYEKWINQWNKGRVKMFLEVYVDVVEECLELLRIVYKGIKNETNDKELLNQLGCFSKDTKGSGIATVISGIFLATKYYKTPKDAIISAVNLIGSDTDSIAAFAGGLLGALYGQGIIPDKWKNVQDIEYLDKVAENLLAISEDRVLENRSNNFININNFKNLDTFGFTEFKDKDYVFFEPLGNGMIEHIEERKTLTNNKFVLLSNVKFDIGQTCVFHKLITRN